MRKKKDVNEALKDSIFVLRVRSPANTFCNQSKEHDERDDLHS
jgi:hypothetical protein